MVRRSDRKGQTVQLDQLVGELLARGDIDDATTLELNRMLADWRAGTLSADDAAYVAALHARLLNLASDLEEPAAAPIADRIDGLSIEEWRERAIKAEAQVAEFEETARNG
jgi:hypothetical protein